MAIDLSELTYDPDFCTNFIIETHENAWIKGAPSTISERTQVIGIVAPSSSKDIELVEAGDRRHGIKTFYTNAHGFLVSNSEKIADFVIWNGEKYKLIHVWNYSANGYWKAIGELMGADDGG